MTRRNLGYCIALSALLISIPRYIATFAGIDAVPLTAYGMGILLAGGTAYIVDAWADATKRGVKHTGWLLAVLAINLAYEPVLLTPFVLSRLWSEPLANVMSSTYAVFWSVMVTLAPVLLVFGVVYAVWFHKQPDARQAQDVSTKAQKSDISAQQVQIISSSGQVPMKWNLAQTSDRYADDQPSLHHEWTLEEAAQKIYHTSTDKVRVLHQRNPDLTPTQLAQQVGCSVSTVSRALSKNGNGRLRESLSVTESVTKQE